MAPWRRRSAAKSAGSGRGGRGLTRLNADTLCRLDYILRHPGGLASCLLSTANRAAYATHKRTHFSTFSVSGHRAPLAMEQEGDAHVVERMTQLLSIDFPAGSRHTRRPLRGGSHRKTKIASFSVREAWNTQQDPFTSEILRIVFGSKQGYKQQLRLESHRVLITSA